MLSVVVPIYNVEPYITECLKSLATQTLEDLEVIMVDDGSTDGSRELAESFAALDSRFTLICQPNQGPGPARNAGLRLAKGVYLAFADADDVVPSEAYELLVGSLEQTGSDLACGGVRRIRDGELEESSLHERPFRRTRPGTHILRKPSLTRDRTVWNKVYRMDFWHRHGLAFPSGIYEDVPVAMRAHVLADSVDVLADVVYHWRRRDDDEGATSITQHRAELDNLRERLAAIRAVRDFLSERAPDLIETFDGLVLEKDIVFLFQALEAAKETRSLVELGRELLEMLSPAVLASASSLRRLELHLLEHGMVPQLRRVRRFRRESVNGTKIVPRGLRTVNWYGDYPYFRSRRRLRIPDSVYDASAELKLLAKVEECTWTGSEFQIRAEVALHRVARRPDSVHLWLSDGRRRVQLEVRRVGRHGVVATVDPRRLKGGGPNWRLNVRTETKGLVLKNVFTDGEGSRTWRLSVPGWSRSGMDMPQ
ncbi:glycosyltransferase family 2 protein [Nonomuraea sp. NPDC000554]|uniref:glycosyltransferase family 2 protein n=1 Tax=Nonomuraea sp. NPDC000554 TaxID=3154259 RepID=UPI00332DEE07